MNAIGTYIFLVPAFFFGISDLHGQQGTSHPKSKHPKMPLKGVASFYSDKFEGRETSSGEIFHQNGMTAACNRLPLNQYVRVTNLRNLRSVTVKITDRMHKNNPRLIDLSRRAALRLGFSDAEGLAKVKVVLLGKSPPPEWRSYEEMFPDGE